MIIITELDVIESLKFRDIALNIHRPAKAKMKYSTNFYADILSMARFSVLIIRVQS